MFNDFALPATVQIDLLLHDVMVAGFEKKPSILQQSRLEAPVLIHH